MGPAASLELRQQVANVRLDRLLREEEALADLAVHEAVRDQLKDLDLAPRPLLLELAERPVERDHLGGARLPARGDIFEATRGLRIPGQNLFALCGVHGPSIGLGEVPL